MKTCNLTLDLKIENIKSDIFYKMNKNKRSYDFACMASNILNVVEYCTIISKIKYVVLPEISSTDNQLRYLLYTIVVRKCLHHVMSFPNGHVREMRKVKVV